MAAAAGVWKVFLEFWVGSDERWKHETFTEQQPHRVLHYHSKVSCFFGCSAW